MTVLAPGPPQWRKTQPPPEGYVTAAAFRDVISYRTLDYWTRTGYLQGSRDPGTGQNRLWPEGEVRIARAIRRLIDAGISADVAATIARDRTGRWPLRHDAVLVMDSALWDQP